MDTEQLEDDLYHKILPQHQKYLSQDGVCHEELLEKLESRVVLVKDWDELAHEAEEVLVQIRELAGDLIYVLSSNIELKELRGIGKGGGPSSAAAAGGNNAAGMNGDENGPGLLSANANANRNVNAGRKRVQVTKQLPCLRKAAVALSGWSQDDEKWPEKNFAEWAVKRFGRSVKNRQLWWMSQLSFARFADLPVCNLSTTFASSSFSSRDGAASTKRLALDVLYNRFLREKVLFRIAFYRGVVLMMYTTIDLVENKVVHMRLGPGKSRSTIKAIPF